MSMKTESVKEFLKRKNVNITVQTYLIDALGAMAFGLFASLLIGTIFGTLGQQFDIEIFNVIADYAKSATGAALGLSLIHISKVSMAHYTSPSLNVKDPLLTFFWFGDIFIRWHFLEIERTG